MRKTHSITIISIFNTGNGAVITTLIVKLIMLNSIVKDSG